MFKKLIILISILLLCFQLSVFAADNTKAVSVTTSATEIIGFNPKRILLVIYNNGTATVYLGFTSADCTTASSMPLPSGSYVKIKGKADSIWGIVSTGTVEVRVWEDDRS